MENGIIVQEKDKNVYYSVQWSRLARADRHEIVFKVPAMAGVYEIYWMDESQHLRLLTVGSARYGGLRSELRRLTDPELVTEPRVRKILAEEEIWYRYALSDSAIAMADVVWFFRVTYFPEKPGVEPSGRYQKVFLKESAPDKVMWVP
jgi:hypothetical protein